MEANKLYMKKYENNLNLLSVSPESLHSNSLYFMLGTVLFHGKSHRKLFSSLLQCTYKQNGINTMNNGFFLNRRLK